MVSYPLSLMHFDTYDQALDRAADLCGVEPHFWDIFGNFHATSTETRKAILRAMGMPDGSREQLGRAVGERLHSEWRRILPPCLVAGGSERRITVPLQVPVHSGHEAAALEIIWEDGQAYRYEVRLNDLPQTDSARFDSEHYVRKQFTVPNAPPLGYHSLRVTIRGLPVEEIALIVTPERAYLPDFLVGGKKTAGIAISLYGLRSDRNWGCGDFHDLRRAIDWVAEMGAAFVALNPLHAIHNRRPYNTSPYLPNSVFYRNPLYLDIEAIADFRASARAQRLWSKHETHAEIRLLRESEFVEYERVSLLKMRFLKLLFVQFRNEMRLGTERAKEFVAYRRLEGDLLNRFATYCALDEHLHARDPRVWVWPDWPSAFQNPDSAETGDFQRKHWRSILFYQYVQWQIDLQLAAAQEYSRQKGLSIGLYHDLALATDRCGSDLWAHRAFYVDGCRVGSPPDEFSPKGQDWAFPPPDAAYHRATGYRLFTESIRKTCRHGGALRIDHVMRFFRLYWIPDGMDATQGAYVRDRFADLVGILALESVRNRVIVVGEDLGTVEPFIRETLARFGILSYRLFYFERAGDGDFKRSGEYPPQSLVSSTTHDLPTLAGFWINADIEARREAGLVEPADYRTQIENRLRDKQKMLDVLFEEGLLPASFSRSATEVPDMTGELHNAAIGFLASTPSMLLVVNQEDLTKETHQQNLPGATSEYPNWSRKMRFTLEQLRSDPRAMGSVRMFRDWMRRTGRADAVRL